MRLVATHWICLEIFWTMPTWQNEALFIFRCHGNRNQWTEEQRAIVREHYVESEREVLLEALRDKSWGAIKKEAAKFGLIRKVKTTIELSNFLIWDDLQFMKEAGIELEDRNTKVVPLSLQRRSVSSRLLLKEGNGARDVIYAR